MAYRYRHSNKTLESAKWIFDVYRGIASNLASKDIDVTARFINDIGSDKIDSAAHVHVYRDFENERADYKDKSFTSAFIPDELRPLAYVLQKEADAFVGVFGGEIGFDFLRPETKEQYKTVENFRKEYQEAKENHLHWKEVEGKDETPSLSAYERLNQEIAQNYGRHYIAHAFKVLKAVALAEMLRLDGVITQDVYSELMAKATQQADSAGLNGIHKMIKHHPELMEWLKKDDGIIEIENRTPVNITSRVPKFKRGEYYVRYAEGSDVKDDTKIDILYDCMGKAYQDAVKEKLDVISTLSKPHPLFEGVLDTPNHARNKLDPETSIKVFLINNGIPLADERLRDIAMRQYGYKEERVGLHPGQIEGGKPSLSGAGEHVKRLTSGKEEPDAEKKSPSSPRRGSEYEGKAPDPDFLNQKTSGGDDKKQDGFVTAGKIGSTAVLGTVLGASLLSMTKKTDEDKDSDDKSKKSKSSKRFIAAIAALASAAGIVLVWKYPDVAFGWLKRGGRSA